jgi:ABC-type multidrug transport system fused ATPase/permease subunit
MVEFRFPSSNQISQFLFTWCFQPFRFYRQNPPNSSTIFSLPTSFDLSSSLKSLNSHWKNEKNSSTPPSFFKALFKTIRTEFLFCSFISLIYQLQIIVQGICVQKIIEFVSNSSMPLYEGILQVACLIVSCFIFTIFKAQSDFRAALLAAKIKALISKMIGKKILKLDNYKLQEENTEGQIFNVLSSDLELFNMLFYTLYLVCTPFVAVATIITIYYLFGPNGMIGVGICLAHIPLIFVVTVLSNVYRKKANRIGDERIKLIRVFIENIKVLKMNVWEDYFAGLIKGKRKEEIKEFIKSGNINILLLVCGLAGSLLAIFCTFYVQLHNGNILNLGKVYLLVFLLINTSIYLSFYNTFAIMLILLYKGILSRVSQLLLLKEKLSAYENSSSLGSILLTSATLSYRSPPPISSPIETETLFRSLNRKISLKTL